MKVYRSNIAKWYFANRDLNKKSPPVKDAKDGYSLKLKDGTVVPLKIIR